MFFINERSGRGGHGLAKFLKGFSQSVRASLDVPKFGVEPIMGDLGGDLLGLNLEPIGVPLDSIMLGDQKGAFAVREGDVGGEGGREGG